MIFFFDNSLSPKLARMLAGLGVQTLALRDKFPVDTKDPVWLSQLADTGWILITSDDRIRTTSANAAALKASGVTTFILGPSFMKMKLWAQAAWLVTHWPAVDEFAQNNPAQKIVRVEHDGSLRVIL